MNLFSILALALAWLAILAGCWLGWQLLRQNGRLLLRVEELEKRLDALEFGEPDGPPGLPAGSLAPDFELPDLAGDRKTLAQYRRRPVLLIFFNPACGFCRELAPKLAALCGKPDVDHSPAVPAAAESQRLPLVISTGDAEQNRQFFAGHKVACPVLLQKEMEVAAAYEANGTPSGYLISSEGRIASGLAMGAEALLALADEKSTTDQGLAPRSASADDDARAGRFSNRSLARSKIKRDGLKAGTRAPSFRLPRLDGGELSLEELRGRRVLLVFSSPHCGPCNTLAPELGKFHRAHADLALLMVSRGEPVENRAKVKEHGLTFPVVLQQQWEISRRYAMFSTPAAYLIDEAGIIASDVAVGADAILDLLKEAVRGINKLNAAPVFQA
jgi:peroxiredoxin